MPDGHRSNVVVCVDDFSKFVILDIIPSRQAEDLRGWILKNVLGPYGRPLQIRSDQGKEFAGAFSRFLKEHNVKHVLSRPHSPWTNGRAERMVRTTKDCIRRVLHEYQGSDWQLLIPYL
jgi:transposase InsO family protein